MHFLMFCLTINSTIYYSSIIVYVYTFKYSQHLYKHVQSADKETILLWNMGLFPLI